MNRILGLFFLAVLWIAQPETRAIAFFCGDPLTDNCAVPEAPEKSSKGPGNSVHIDNHPLTTYVLVPERDLRENFEDWGKAAGWKVVWKSEYTFPVKARFTAGRTFLGAIRRSVRIFNHSSGGWLRVRAFMANHVLLVEDGR
ncbi:toxin co-regulated pilus biosynthesis Q family protein [Leptospirillum ferriphilum]|uniref:Toxin co-regulated pilus biosynthesis protein Q C-terminal domain-containing protein n=1 Tax=Leptospirillum ferriphilum TaxID=178606 RepID=A0A1V3SVB2_9BACT|nr:toxin co-regulated pilus biosynthesis Q family protein [Leptospirillum ferriphilum]OOH72811.1 hypothetical protein BOX24_05325 [Leptospirillum ferriphilum]